MMTKADFTTRTKDNMLLLTILLLTLYSTTIEKRIKFTHVRIINTQDRRDRAFLFVFLK
jgi:hypothetical protein